MGQLADKVLSHSTNPAEKIKESKRISSEKALNYVARKSFDCDDFSDLEQQSNSASKPEVYRSHWR